MAFILCGVHGGHPAALVCEHIAYKVLCGQPVADLTLAQAESEGAITWSVWLCCDCAREHRYSESLVIRSGERGLEEIFALGHQTPVCPECLKDRQQLGEVARPTG